MVKKGTSYGAEFWREWFKSTKEVRVNLLSGLEITKHFDDLDLAIISFMIEDAVEVSHERKNTRNE